jgi:hypothetical protein
VAVTNVEFYVDGVLKGSDATSPYSYSWDTTTATNASHSLTTKAYDAAGNIGTSAGVSVTVNNTAPDTTAPTTAVTAPAAGATVSGAVSITGSASDNVGVTSVEFYVDGVLKGSDATSPYAYSWDTTTATNASHSLTTKAYDAAGNVGTSAAVSVTVNNPVSGELIVNGGFETNTTPWVRATNYLWTGSSTVAHTGTGYAYAGTVNSIDTTMYQTITIPTTATGTLTFWTRIITNEGTTTTVYDKMMVEVRNTSGTVLGTLATYSNANYNTAWAQKTLSLAAYKGQTVRLTFHVTTDSSLTTNFRVDDVSVK